MTRCGDKICIELGNRLLSYLQFGGKTVFLLGMTTLSSCSMLIPLAARLTPYLVLVIRVIQVTLNYEIEKGEEKISQDNVLLRL